MMKICVIQLDGMQGDVLFADERLKNLRHLADIGLYGALESGSAGEPGNPRDELPILSAIWEPLSQQCPNSALLAPVANRSSAAPMSHDRWNLLAGQLGNSDWDYIHFIDRSLLSESPASDSDSTHPCLALDDHVGQVIERLDSNTVLLVICNPVLSSGSESPAIFLLASSNCPLSGEHPGAQLCDLTPTLLDLAGHPLSQTARGRSLVAGREKRATDPEQQQIVLDRLSGLGYV